MSEPIDIGRKEGSTTTYAVKKFIVFANLVSDGEDISNLNQLKEEFLCNIETWKYFAGFLKGLALKGEITKQYYNK